MCVFYPSMLYMHLGAERFTRLTLDVRHRSAHRHSARLGHNDDCFVPAAHRPHRSDARCRVSVAAASEQVLNESAMRTRAAELSRMSRAETGLRFAACLIEEACP